MEDLDLHPPIDAELKETVFSDAIAQTTEFTLENIGEMQPLVGSLMRTDEELSLGGLVAIEERSIPAPLGLPEMPALILRPADRATRAGLLPCLYVTANGGKILQDARALFGPMPDWVAELGLVIISISPPVGPKHPHPALIEGAYAGLVWIVEHADQLGIDRERIIVYGVSGGGGLAAATALLARDRGGPALAHQMLLCPMLDDRAITRSSRFQGVPWTPTSNRTGWTVMLGDACGGPDVSPYAAPSRATDLHSLPPAYLEIATADLFRDETIDYATRLLQADVPTELHCWVGGFHGFDVRAPEAEISRSCTATRTSYLRRALRPTKSVEGDAPRLRALEEGDGAA